MGGSAGEALGPFMRLTKGSIIAVGALEIGKDFESLTVVEWLGTWRAV